MKYIPVKKCVCWVIQHAFGVSEVSPCSVMCVPFWKSLSLSLFLSLFLSPSLSPCLPVFVSFSLSASVSICWPVSLFLPPLSLFPVFLSHSVFLHTFFLIYVSKHQLFIIIDMLTYVKKHTTFSFWFICLWLSFSLSSQAQLFPHLNISLPPLQPPPQPQSLYVTPPPPPITTSTRQFLCFHKIIFKDC